MFYIMRFVNFLTRQIAPEWLVAGASIGVCIGVMSVGYFQIANNGSAVWFWLGIAILPIVIIARKNWAIPLVILAGFLIGSWRGGVTQYELNVYENIIGHSVEIEGVLSEDPDVDKNNHTTVRLEKININGNQIPGKVWVSFDSKYPVHRGDTVVANGKIQEGFAGFSGSMYRAKVVQTKRPDPQDPALRFRHWFDGNVEAMISEPASSLGLGFLLGERRGLPADLESSLRIAGLMHVVVASGYNLTILVRLARRVFARVSKFMAAFSGGLLTVGFIAVTGISPSMSRAGLIAGLSLLAWYYGRRFHPLVLLPFAAATTLLFNPSYGWNDLGWALSFTAFAGVMVLAPLFHAYFFGDKKPGTLRQIMGETIAAQLFTFPLILITFGTFSVVGVVANMLILPLVPLAMLLTFITGLVHAAFPFMATIFAAPTELLLSYMTTVAAWCAKPGWALVEMQVEWWHVGLIYLTFAAACIWMWRVTRYSFRDSSIVD